MTEQKREMVEVSMPLPVTAEMAEVYRKANDAELKRIQHALNTRIFGELA